MGMTPSQQKAHSAESPQSVMSWTGKALALGCTAFAFYAWSIHAKPFEDEYAYITQSYYADFFFRGALDHPVWLDFFAYDVQPLPKYLIGLSFSLCQSAQARCFCGAGLVFELCPFRHSRNLDGGTLAQSGSGALGCVALFGCGTLVKDSRLGAIAALLLMVNPLYSLHAHRAMSDVQCEAFVTLALGLSLLSWKSAWSARGPFACTLYSILAGGAGGLALLCKFNGAPCASGRRCVDRNRPRRTRTRPAAQASLRVWFDRDAGRRNYGVRCAQPLPDRPAAQFRLTRSAANSRSKPLATISVPGPASCRFVEISAKNVSRRCPAYARRAMRGRGRAGLRAIRTLRTIPVGFTRAVRFESGWRRSLVGCARARRPGRNDRTGPMPVARPRLQQALRSCSGLFWRGSW